MTRTFLAVTMAAVLAAPARAEVAWTSDIDEWSNAIGDDFTTITFTELGEVGQFLDDQYADYGILFPELDDHTQFAEGFENDNWGASGFGATLTVDFAEEVSWVGVHYPGGMTLHVYRDGELVGEAPVDLPGGFGFLGFISSEPFDRAVFIDPVGSVNIDDLHIPVIPAPGVLPLLVIGLALGTSRRRG